MGVSERSVERADCGILLDVNNITFVDEPRVRPDGYVNAVQAHRVGQIHIAGHSKYEKYILDTHDTRDRSGLGTLRACD